MSLSRNLVTIYKGYNRHLSNSFYEEGFSEITANSYQYLIAVYKLKKYEKIATTTGVANRLGVKNASAVQMINALLKTGYLIKKSNSADKRSSILELSEKGFKMMRFEEKFSDEFFSIFFASLTAEELKLLEKTSEKIAIKIEENRSV
ncbi:hypothetical protein EBB07_25910 [Paenibacillaceae bacterium]|nr:hypothetical protein EBB07_25910 [Paenibacillaceae bacterium]